MKRPFEATEADNYIFGNVSQPVKRNRIGTPIVLLQGIASSIKYTEKGEPGKLPPGYICRRCESTEVLFSSFPAFLSTHFAQTIIVAFHQRVPTKNETTRRLRMQDMQYSKFP